MNEDIVALKAIQSLKDKQPFSAIRLGDGEGRVLLYPDGIERKVLDRHLRFWFGRCDYSHEMLMWIKNRLLLSVKYADAVGFYHGDGASRFWRVAQNYPLPLRDDVIECENKLHRQLWDSGLFQNIIDAAEKIVMVTCRDGIVFTKHDCVTIPVPEEANTGHRETDHLERYPQIAHDIRWKSRPGVLVLVGAGVLGKCYCTEAQAWGAVALDIGSLFDLMAGVHSRSWISKTHLTKRQTSYILEAEANRSADHVSCGH